MTTPSPLTKEANGAILAVKVTPKARQNAIEGVEIDAENKAWLKVKTTIAPENGKATKAVIKYLAKQIGVSASSITLLSGEVSRYKRLHIPFSYEEIAECLKLI